MAIDYNDALADEGADVLHSMNTTPLIDILLVLLVMLIITIPIQLHSVSIDLPIGQPVAGAVDPWVVRIDLSRSSQLFWNAEPVTDLAALETRLMEAARQAVQPEIHIHADPRTRYEAVAAVLTIAQRAGLQKIGVVDLETASQTAP